MVLFNMEELPAPVDINQISHFNNPYRYLQQVVSRAIELSSANNDPITGLVVSRLYTDSRVYPELSEVLCAVIESRCNSMQHYFFKSWVEGLGAQLRIEKENLVKDGDCEGGLVYRVQEALDVPSVVELDEMDRREG
jgi:hypothetical protein